MSAAEGLLLLDKPEGPTSHDVVARVRRLLGQRRVGHAGTLDPRASGLLPLVLGRATRLVRFLPDSPKVYRGSLRLGLTTSTDDLDGEPRARHEGPLPAAERVRAEAERLVGAGMQRPPAFSARKVGGQRLYRLARRGVEVEAPAKPVEIRRFELEPAEEPGLWVFEAEVSGGTYIRALVRDLGEALGCGGTLARLRRTAIGPLRVEQALAVSSLDELDAEGLSAALVPVDRMPLVPPAVRLEDPRAVRGFLSGMHVTGPAAAPGLYRVVDPAGRLLGIAEATDGGLRPRVVVSPPAEHAG